jgi:hypothetical protein
MTSHHGQIVLGAPSNHGPRADQACLTARFVHYPDCQQLILWLPHPGRDYQRLRITDLATGTEALSFAVADRLQGSIQLLLDTSVLPAGQYTLTVNHRQGWQHQIHLHKLAESELPPVAAPAPAPTSQSRSSPPQGPEGYLRYRDGAGRAVPDADLDLRRNETQRLAARFQRHLRYENHGRAGYVCYVEGELQLKFAYEIGGLHCVAWVEVPSAAHWEQATGLPLARRDDILQFTATHLRAQQGPSCRVQIRADSIVLLH